MPQTVKPRCCHDRLINPVASFGEALVGTQDPRTSRARVAIGEGRLLRGDARVRAPSPAQSGSDRRAGPAVTPASFKIRHDVGAAFEVASRGRSVFDRGRCEGCLWAAYQPLPGSDEASPRVGTGWSVAERAPVGSARTRPRSGGSCTSESAAKLESRLHSTRLLIANRSYSFVSGDMVVFAVLPRTR